MIKYMYVYTTYSAYMYTHITEKPVSEFVPTQWLPNARV